MSQENESATKEQSFVSGFNTMQTLIHEWAERKGWNEDYRNRPPVKDAETIALIHSELSEALEGMRHNNPASDKIPEFTSIEEEYADVIIRIMHHAAERGYRVAEALVAKNAYNEGRAFKHGKQF